MQAGWDVDLQIGSIKDDLGAQHRRFLRDQRRGDCPLIGVENCVTVGNGAFVVVAPIGRVTADDVRLARNPRRCLPVWITIEDRFRQCPPLYKSVVARPVKSVCEPDW